MTSTEEREAGAARAYHDATKHSSQSVRASRHSLDWEAKPFLFKVYPEAPALTLPREVPAPAGPALETLARVVARPGGGVVDLPALAQLLFFSAGLTKKKVYPGGETLHFRAAASTGALYEVEVYVVAGAVPGLEPGVYHFCPGDFTLRRLRAGDWRAALADASGEPDRVRAAPATLVLSAIYWRNTWKYQARAFRHFFWDAGTMLANLLATAVAADVPARILLGFADAAVNRLLGLDVTREASLAVVPLGTGALPPPSAPAPEPLTLATVPLSSREVDYPLVRAAHLASSLPDGAAARAWVGARRPHDFPAGGESQPSSRRDASGLWPSGRPVPPAVPPWTRPPGGDELSQSTPASTRRLLGEAILRRGSTREFDRVAIGAAELSAILDASVRDLPLDAGGPAGTVVDSYVLVHAVDGLAPGAHVWEPARRELRLLRGGEFRAEGGYLCLEQALGADASAVVFFLSDLRPVLERYGNRGYRAVNLAAGLLGGRLYLAAYALGLGASGLTFYDDDVVRFFSPDAAGKDAIFVMALGRPRRTAKPRGLAQVEGEIRPLRPGEP